MKQKVDLGRMATGQVMMTGDVARMVGLDCGTVRYHVEKGHLKMVASLPNGRRLFAVEDVLAFIASHARRMGMIES